MVKMTESVINDGGAEVIDALVTLLLQSEEAGGDRESTAHLHTLLAISIHDLASMENADGGVGKVAKFGKKSRRDEGGASTLIIIDRENGFNFGDALEEDGSIEVVVVVTNGSTEVPKPPSGGNWFQLDGLTPSEASGSIEPVDVE